MISSTISAALIAASFIITGPADKLTKGQQESIETEFSREAQICLLRATLMIGAGAFSTTDTPIIQADPDSGIIALLLPQEKGPRVVILCMPSGELSTTTEY